MDNEKKEISYLLFEAVQARNERTIKRLVAIIMILVALLFASNMAWLYVFQSYDTIEYSQDGEGVNNVNVGEQGDVINEPNSENTNQKESEEK